MALWWCVGIFCVPAPCDCSRCPLGVCAPRGAIALSAPPSPPPALTGPSTTPPVPTTRAFVCRAFQYVPVLVHPASVSVSCASFPSRAVGCTRLYGPPHLPSLCPSAPFPCPVPLFSRSGVLLPRQQQPLPHRTLLPWVLLHGWRHDAHPAVRVPRVLLSRGGLRALSLPPWDLPNRAVPGQLSAL
jgi:hypothetical protein